MGEHVAREKANHIQESGVSRQNKSDLAAGGQDWAYGASEQAAEPSSMAQTVDLARHGAQGHTLCNACPASAHAWESRCAARCRSHARIIRHGIKCAAPRSSE